LRLPVAAAAEVAAEEQFHASNHRHTPLNANAQILVHHAILACLEKNIAKPLAMSVLDKHYSVLVILI
jgi:hypothetical protein